MQQRSIPVCILLSLVTCGIYSIYWYYTIAEGFQQCQTQSKLSTTAGMTILLNIVTCGIYGIYAYYKWGQATSEIYASRGLPPSDKGVLYIVLAIFGLSLVNMALIQSDFNDWMTPTQG